LRMDLRKKSLPEGFTGQVRLVMIGDIDVAHCGGTHLCSTGELQLVKITGIEKVRDQTRLTFLAGRRATTDYSEKHWILNDLSTLLTCGIEDLPDRVAKMQDVIKAASRELKRTRMEMISAQVDKELEKSQKAGKYMLYAGRSDGWTVEELKMLAGGMTSKQPRLVCCCGSEVSNQAFVVLAAGREYAGDLGLVVAQLLPGFNAKGGGKGNFAQVIILPEKLDEFLAQASGLLRAEGGR
jgi:alanyl-tRNA synthetase